MAAKVTKMTHKIAIQLHLVAQSCTICSSRSRGPVRKLLDTPLCAYKFKILKFSFMTISFVLCLFHSVSTSRCRILPPPVCHWFNQFMYKFVIRLTCSCISFHLFNLFIYKFVIHLTTLCIFYQLFNQLTYMLIVDLTSLSMNFLSFKQFMHKLSFI
jgi:hypothetical protein